MKAGRQGGSEVETRVTEPVLPVRADQPYEDQELRRADELAADRETALFAGLFESPLSRLFGFVRGHYRTTRLVAASNARRKAASATAGAAHSVNAKKPIPASILAGNAIEISCSCA